MAMNTTKFASVISKRRSELGLTQQEVAEAGGPSDTTQRKVEAAADVPVSTMTLRKYDAAFKWAPGTAARMLNDDPASYAPVNIATRRPRHGAWQLDNQILADLSLAADTVYDLAQAAEAVDTEDDIESIIDAAHDLAEAADKLIELAQAVAEVGVGGRVHLQILKSKTLADPQQPTLTGANQGERPDYELAARPGETEDEARERLGIPYD